MWEFGLAPGGNLGQSFQIAQKCTNKFQSLARFSNNERFQIIFFLKTYHKILHLEMQLLFFCCLEMSPKNGPKVKKGGMKIKNCTTTGITQVLGQLKQKFFHQQLVLE